MNAKPPAATASHDPLLHEIDLALTQVLYPLGFPLEIATNSPAVARAAEAAWSGFPNLFPEPPIHLRAIVTASSAAAGPVEPPVYRGQGHLFTISAGPFDFAVADLERGFSFAHITPSVAADVEYLRYFFLEALVYATLTSLHLTTVHAACVSLGGRAVLLCGSSGAGKSTLAYECARRGFTYIADDGSSFLRRGGDRTVIGRPMRLRFRPAAGKMFPELRDLLPGLSMTGKPTLEIDTAILPGIQTAFTARVAAVVFLNRAPQFDPHYVAISRQEARERLVAEIPVLEHRTWQEQIDSLDMLLDAHTFELRYTEAAQAAAALESLLKKEHRDKTAVLGGYNGGPGTGAGGIERAAR